VILGPSLTCAQAVPDAGSLLQQLERDKQPALPPKSALQFAPPPPPMQSLGPAILTVSEFRFAGNTLLNSARLARVVAGFVGRPLDFAQLQNAAIAVATAYRSAGWVVRVYLPEQDATAGIVTIQIVEARFGKVRVEGEHKPISVAQVTSLVAASQKVDTPLNANALDRALLLIGDLPGLTATGKLAEGESWAQTDLVVDLARTPLFSGMATADNTGERATGAGRLSADVSINSPLGFGDQVEATVLASQGSNYERAAYSLPAGSEGWRVGANASHLRYKVVSSDLEALDAHGASTTTGIEASYPLWRSRLKNLFVAFNVDNKLFDNDSSGATATHYKIDTVSARVYGNLFDDIVGGGANTASITLEQGNDNLAGSPNESADGLSTRAAGSFEKVRFTASRQQTVTDRWSLYASLSGQGASKNLDSSEKFYLGGVEGVRAYPENEGGGAQGLLANLEARVRLPKNFSATGFFDWGSVQINKHNDIEGAAVPNRDDLKGVGFSVGWRASFGLIVKGTYAHRLGANPDRTSTGNDADGSHIDNRIWVQVSMPF
jgi:hemolysin activation/secretion protein